MKFNKIFAIPALALTLFGLSACTDEVKYDPAKPESNAEVFFAATTPSSISLDNDQNSFSVDIYRADKSGSITVTLSGNSTDNLFTIPSQVTFADGSDVATVPVDFNFSSIEANKSYNVTITIDDAAATPYGKRTQTIAVKYAPWTDWVTNKQYGEYTLSVRYSGAYDVIIKQRSNLLDPNEVQYIVNDLFPNDIVIDLDKATNVLTVEPQDIDMPYQEVYKCYVVDSYTFYTKVVDASKLSNPVDPEDFKDGSTLDPETGMMTLDLVYYVVMGTQVGWFGPGYEYLQLPGYPDYKLYFSNNGTQITEAGEELAVVTIAKGEDVNGFAMKLVDGYLSEANIEKVADQIKADENSTIYFNSGDYTFPMTTSGYKTLVCVTYTAEGEVIGTQYYQFNYELQQVDWNEGWKSLGKMNYTDYCVFTKAYTWEVEVQESESKPGYLRIVKPYASHPGVDADEIERGHFYIYIDATNPNQVYIPMSETCLGYDIMSYGYYMLAIGKTEADVTDAGMWGTYKDGKVTFPAESLVLAAGSNLYLSSNTEEVAILEPISDEDDDNEELSAKVNSLNVNTTVKSGKSIGTFFNGVSGTPLVVKKNGRLAVRTNAKLNK